MKVVVIGRPSGPGSVCSKVEPFSILVGIPVTSMRRRPTPGTRRVREQRPDRSTGASISACCFQEAVTSA